MLGIEIFRVALGAIRANKLRSFLTMLGIIIGIAAVIAMVALGEGAQRSVQESLDAMGTDVLTVRPGRQMFGGVDRGSSGLTTRDAEALRREARYVRAVAPEMDGRLQVETRNANANLSVTATWPSYFDVNSHTIAAGRLFTEGEDRGRRRIAVLGALVGEQLGVENTAMLVGQDISIRGLPFEVIGVLEEKGGMGWRNPDEAIYIPLATAQFRVLGDERLESIAVQAESKGVMPNAMAEIDRILRREHKIRAGEESDFTIRDNASIMSTFQETTQAFTFLLAGIAFISLVVGGIGIMNIMLVSVTERTREIGIRKALGARRGDVLLQFLVEAVVLCLAGGLIGVGLGVGMAVSLQRMAGWNTAVSPEAALMALGFSAAVGIFFGLWPARRAAKLDPITALRYE